MNDASTVANAIAPELDSDEKLLWSGLPNWNRMMLPAIPVVLFGIGWNAFMINFIFMVSNGPQNVQGPGGLFGRQGILANLFFLPFIAVGIGTLTAPIWIYRSAKRTVYGITDKRVIIISHAWSKKVQSYSPRNVSEFQRVERNDGSGDIIFGKRNVSESESNHGLGVFRLVGIPDVRNVEKLLRTLANDTDDTT